LDFKILDALKKDARTPFVALAKELNVTPGIVQARYYKMKESGLIKGTTLMLGVSKMAKRYMGSIGIDALESELEDVIKYINSLKVDEAQIITWSTFGRYNIASIVFTKNAMDIQRLRQLIKQHPAVKEASMNLTNYNKSWRFMMGDTIGE
jgi:Transcriptional regulators